MNKSLSVAAMAVLLMSFPLRSAPEYQHLDPAKLQQIDDAINQAIDEHRLPGAVVWVEHEDEHYWKAYGNRALVPQEEPMTRDTIFDAASITKVLATTPAIMLLVERGKVSLDATVHSYIPEFTGEGKRSITVRQLMTHTSGLPEDVSLDPPWHGLESAIRLASGMKLKSVPGAQFRYSDINFFLLGEIVARVSHEPLNNFCTKEIYRPLKMFDTGFLPEKAKLPRVAPTEVVEGKVLRGVVHDPTARAMGGVAGHAGVFTTAPDLARYARMMMNMGTLDGVRIFKPETVKLMTSVQSPPDISDRRGLGWDIDSGFTGLRGQHFPRGGYGHTGFTGTALWIDPFSKSFFIFLSNRVHPNGQGNVLKLYRTVGTLAAEAVTDFDFNYVPGQLAAFPHHHHRGSVSRPSTEPPRTLNGIDVLVNENFERLRGLRIGLITNPTGKDWRRYPTIDLLRNAPGVDLRMLFGPEHGLYGNHDEPVTDGVDEHTGLPIYSLYGARHAPTAEQLDQLDALVFDLQDVGCRFYTYTTTLGLAMEAADREGLKFFVLDRINPLNGLKMDGPVLTEKTSFVGWHPLPIRSGMTEGELAGLYKAERHLDNLDLTVIPLQGWKRSYWYDETGQPWTGPSPNLHTLTEAMLYPGVGLLESCSVSVGRGTFTPFEVIGAPWIEDVRLAEAMNAAALPGVRFVPVRFTPTDYIYKNQSCGGINVILTDREKCQVVDIGITAAEILNRWYPDEFKLDGMDRLLMDKPTLRAIEEGKSLGEIHKLWAPKLSDFKSRREKYLLYH
jgi:uncharacterized protein YbbC (DUF1343 family)/CubicO group peptidase (beta-lactamase class C family)